MVILIIKGVWWSTPNNFPDPPSRLHLLRSLRSLLFAAYYSYASVGTPRCLTSNTFLEFRALLKSTTFIHKGRFDGTFIGVFLISPRVGSDSVRLEDSSSLCLKELIP